MKKQITNLKNKTTKFLKDNETVVKLSIGYALGATVAFAAMADQERRRWDRIDTLNSDRPENSLLVRGRDGTFGYVIRPKKEEI